MGRAKPVQLGDTTFESKKVAREHFQQMLARYTDGDKISNDDSITLYDLLLRHPNAESKMSGGILHFVKESAEPTGSCFHLVDEEGHLIDFSIKHCINGNTPSVRARFSAACRAAVFDDLATAKSKMLAQQAAATATGDGTRRDWKLVHKPPAFKEIVDSFIASNNIQPDESLLLNNSLQYGAHLLPPDLAEAFRAHHEAECNLELERRPESVE